MVLLPFLHLLRLRNRNLTLRSHADCGTQQACSSAVCSKAFLMSSTTENVSECSSVLIDVAITLHKRLKPIFHRSIVQSLMHLYRTNGRKGISLLIFIRSWLFTCSSTFRFSHISRKPICMPLMTSLHLIGKSCGLWIFDVWVIS